MENATKALQMAAGVLVSIMILGLVVYGYNSLAANRKVEQDVIREEQAVNFNKSFEGYNKDTLRGSDLISLANKVEDYNARYLSTDGYTTIELIVTNISTVIYPTYYSTANDIPNKLAEVHKNLQNYIRTTGNEVKASYGGKDYTYKELYALYKKGSNLNFLATILSKANAQEARDEVANWTYTKRIKGMEDFSRHTFSKLNWEYDSYGRIAKIEFKYD